MRKIATFCQVVAAIKVAVSLVLCDFDTAAWAACTFLWITIYKKDAL